MFCTTFDPIDALGAHRGAQSLKKFAKIQIFSVQAKTTGNTVLQKLIIICWCGYCGYGEVDCDPKMGGGHLGVFDVGKTLLLVNGCKS